MAGKSNAGAIAAGLVCMLAAAPMTLSAQGNQGGGQGGMHDSTFVMEAASGGLMEVQLGKLAQQKASNAQVKQFGQRMVTDHSKANKQLIAAAKQDGMTPPTTLMPEHQQHVDMLKAQSGQQFDKAYMSMMVQDHMKDVQSFQQESTSGSSPHVKQFASQTLPVLEQHLTNAKQVASQVGADTAGTTMPQPQQTSGR